jgi:peroxiredoxin Q/BCP
MLEIGEVAPTFTSLATNGRRVSLDELRGRRVVIYFFPKAFTPGCSRETRRFAAVYDEILALGAEVIGISLDSYATQCQFASRMGAPFPMIGDRDGAISKAYRVQRSWLPFDKRTTYVLDEEGVVRAAFQHEFEVVRHVESVVKFLQTSPVRQATP